MALGGFGGMLGGGGGNIIGSAAVRLLLDAAKFNKDLTGAQARMQRFGKGMSTVGGALTRGVSLPLAGAAIAAIKFASDAAETENKVRVTFGKMADEILQWSNTSIEKMGLAKQGAQDMASQFGLLLSAAKLPGPEVVSLSKQFTQLAGDMSSFFNIPFEDALTTLRSGLVGETEPLRRFGVLLSEARVKGEGMRLGLVKQGQELTEQQKVQVRSSLIMGDLSKAQGDFARTSGDVANRTRSAKERVKEMAAEIGKDLLPVTKDALEAVQGLLGGFSNLSEGARENILKFGLLAIALGPVLRLLGSLAVLASPGGALVLGIGSLTAAIIYAQGATERYEKAVEILAEKLKVLKQGTQEFDREYAKLATNMMRHSNEIIRGFGGQAIQVLEDAHKRVRQEMGKQLDTVQLLNNALAAENKTLTIGELNSIKSAIAHRNYALAARLVTREARESKDALDAQGRGMDALSRNSNDAANATEAVIRAQKELARMLGVAEQKVKNMDAAMFNLAERFRNMPSPPNVVPSGGGGGGGGTSSGQQRHQGGPIPRSGWYNLQAGEHVLSRQTMRAMDIRPSASRSRGDVNIYVSVNGDVIDTDRWARKVMEAVGSQVSRYAGV